MCLGIANRNCGVGAVLECTSGRHNIIHSRYCARCGELIHKHIIVCPNCHRFHKEKKGWRYNFCPDCGVPLRDGVQRKKV